jgi:hypothetical protein
MTKKKQPESQEPVEDFILRHFEDNFLRLKFESGHGLAPEVKEAAKRQVLFYWRRLKDIAKTITDTEVRLNLPGQKTPKKRKFCIEGVVDIVRERGRTVMYDLKTHDPDHVRQKLFDYERQLNVYAFIWKNLRQQDLNETAILATQFPASLNAAWENRDQNAAAFEQQLQQWDPIIPIPLDPQHVQETIQELARVVDDIEEGKYSPPPISRLKRVESGNQIFATRVCRNCDVRFSCSTYREYVQTSKSRDLPRFREIYEDVGTDEDRQSRIDAGLGTVAAGTTE